MNKVSKGGLLSLYYIRALVEIVSGYVLLSWVIGTFILGIIIHLLFLAIFFCIIFLIGGVLLIEDGYKLKRFISLFRNCVSVISINGTEDINEIADIVQVSPQKLKKQLKLMIDRGFFTVAYLDRQQNKIIVKKADYKPDEKLITLNCRSCGAPTTLPENAAKRCGWCGCVLDN